MSMLHRSFKPAKCKTALKLAVSRIKLLKNKREAQLTQLKREVAQLLESGQDRTARIRVEHVVREEKTTAAYELIEIYCELIAARLSIIESQKNCPIDLKEAISSVIFASPRCADIPELMDIRKHFTAKYGKEFVSAAIELRPDCGVDRMLVEKLSAKAPDGQTKIKILSAIAEKHNVKWDPNSLEEQDSRPPEDFLNGPNTFEKASKIYVEPHVQAPPSRDDKGPPNVQVPPEHDANHDVSGHFYEHNARSSPPSQNFDSADGAAKGATTFGTFHPDVGCSGNGSEERESRYSYSGDGDTFSLGRQNWDMEFKDATAAAQAAAESAERASMAARAAAELSSRGKVTGQYSMESQKSSAEGLSGERSQKYTGSKLRGEHLTKHPVNDALPGRNSSMHDEQIDHTEQDILAGATESFYRNDHKDTPKSTWSASLKSTTASLHKNPLVNSSQKIDRYPQKNLSELENSDSLGGSSNNEIEFVGELDDGTESENIDYIGDVGIRRKYSMESHESSAKGLSSEGSQKYAGSKLRGEHLAKHPVNNVFPGRNSSMHDEQIDRTEQDILAGATESFYRNDHKNTAKSTWPASLKSTTASVDKNPLVSSSQKTDRYPQKNSSELENSDSLDGVSMKKQSSNNETEFVGELNDGTESENIDYIGDVGIRKQSSRASSHSHSSTFIDDHNDNLNLNHQNLGNDAGRGPFGIDQGNSHSDNQKTTSYYKASVVFDEYGSDDGDDYKFDVENEFKGQESSLYFSSPGRKSPVNLLGNTDAWSIRKNMDASFEKSISQSHSSSEQHSSLVFSESSTVLSQPHDLLHVTYDDSDGQSSDGEENLEKSKLVGGTELGVYPREQNVHSRNSELNKSASHGLIGSSSAEKENVTRRKSLLPPSSVDSDPEEVCLKTNRGNEFPAVSDRKFSYSDLPSSKLEKSGLDSSTDDKEHMPQLPDTWKDNELLKESSFESGNELNFGKLTGGLRNKGFRRPPNIGSPSGNASSVKQGSGDTSSKIEQPSSSVMVRTSISPNASNREPQNQKVTLEQSKEPSSRAPVSSSDSDHDDSEQLSQQNISSNQEPYNQKVGTKVNKNSRSRVPITYFDADASDSEEDLPKQASTSNARPVTGFSRRTKAASSSTSRNSYSKATDRSEASLTPDYGAGRKSSSRSSYATEALAKPLSQTKSSDHMGSSEQRRSAERATVKPMPESKRSLNEESLKSSTREHSSRSLPKILTSGSTEISKSANPSAETPSVEKASHVHPKLPDYEALTAHFQSLRESR